MLTPNEKRMLATAKAMAATAVLLIAFHVASVIATEQQTDPPPQSTFYVAYKVALRMNQAGCTLSRSTASAPRRTRIWARGAVDRGV